MKIAVVRHFSVRDNFSDVRGNFSKENFSKTEKLADVVLENLLKNFSSLYALENYSSALFVGTTVGGLDRSEEEYLSAKKSGKITPELFARHEAGEMTNFLAKKYNLGQSFTISAACSSGLHVIGLAKKAIEKDEKTVRAADRLR